jgi:hypothetical protein
VDFNKSIAKFVPIINFYQSLRQIAFTNIAGLISFMRKFLLTIFVMAAFAPLHIYGQGYFSGSFQSNTNFYIRDSAIGAANLPHYDNYKVGSDIWFNLNYNNDKYGLEAGVRFDAFLNSILRNPTTPYTGVGLGSFYIKKKFKDLTITGGYLYDQIGCGMIYRAYEERTLGIDNALIGGRVEYDIKNIVHLKVFSGVQKNVFSIYNPIISGFNGDANFTVGKVTLAPGVGIINRSMDQGSMNLLVASIEATDSAQRFVPKYNVYAFTFYNTLSFGPMSWYVEGSYKTRDAAYALNSLGQNVLLNKTGNAVYSSLNISQKGLGVTLLFKRVQDFTLRTSPNEKIFQGLLNFEPPVPRQNSLRLPSRYFASSLEQHELAFGTEVTWTPVKKLSFLFNGSYVRDFLFQPALIREQVVTTGPGGSDTTYKDHKNFFGEANIEAHYKPNHNLELELGFQYIFYNRPIYQGDGGNIPAEYKVNSYTPFAEISQRINRKMSYRIELQYQYVPNDFGQWIYGLFELNVAPNLSFAVSDMWNFKPNPINVVEVYQTPHHFYSVFAAYTYGPHRFSLNYVKQVAGIVCTGGVCRYEPAFSGVKFSVTSTF